MIDHLPRPVDLEPDAFTPEWWEDLNRLCEVVRDEPTRSLIQSKPAPFKPVIRKRKRPHVHPPKGLDLYKYFDYWSGKMIDKNLCGRCGKIGTHAENCLFYWPQDHGLVRHGEKVVLNPVGGYTQK